jgi:hypothetical protein
LFQSAAVLIIVFAGMTLDWHFRGAAASRRQDSLKRELNEILRMQGSKQLSLNSSFKTDSGVLDEVDVSAQNADQVKEWYFERLQSAGWTFKGAESRGDDQAFRFCRNQETFFLQFPKNTLPNHNTDFKVQIGWGGPWDCSYR